MPFRQAHSSMPATIRTTARLTLVAAILHIPQDRGVAHCHAEPAHQSLGWSTTRAVAEQFDDPGQAGGPACERGGQPGMALGEDPTLAPIVPAPPARQLRLYGNWRPLGREIPQRPLVRAVTRTR